MEWKQLFLNHEQKTIHPPKVILERYADVMINFALGGGTGIKKGDVVLLQCDEACKPMYAELYRAVIKAGGHVISNYAPMVEPGFNLAKDFYTTAKPHQLDFFAFSYNKGMIDQIDHILRMDCETDVHALSGIDPKKILRRGEAYKPAMTWRRKKEQAGKLTWTIGLYGTPAMAKEAGMSEKAYWDQIITACFLDTKDPIAHWKKTSAEIQKYVTKLNKLQIQSVHVSGPDADLTIRIGEQRKWLGGGGANIPSFEIFTSPDWRGTNGWIRLNQPLYTYGNLVEGIYLEFKDGVVTKATATKNQKFLKQMIATPNADKLGEFSMTDKRHSRITKFMAETLYDENIGGPNGNSHIALGLSYLETFTGDVSKLNDAQIKKLGYNTSSVHTDVITTTPRTVTATLSDGSTKVIYKNGMFTI